ncbi:MAG: carboxypeptidase-like regulatory domain-containing protein [Daejeonella sp.]
MKKALLMLLGVFLFVTVTVAQEKTVTGKVIDNDGLTLPGVSVKVKGTNTGVSTGADGNYSIRVSPGAVLQFSFIGSLAQERTVGTENVIDITLRADSKSLDEVVITAFGIQQAKRSLGYSVQDIKGAELVSAQRDNFINSMQGRVAGARITSTSGTPGASSQIVLRGISSLEGDNQPLFVVDGIPISNNTLNTGTGGVGIGDTQNRFTDNSNRGADINPEDIESITILKGAEV